MSSQLTVQVLPYDPEWPAIFNSEAAKIQAALGSNCIQIHHIGSTAIPNLPAKPVIDIIPVVKNIQTVDLSSPSMQLIGYQPRGESGMLFRRFFQKLDSIPSFHLHVYQEDNSEIDRHLLFRDYLRSHHDDMLAYVNLKQQLAKTHPKDITAYCFGKNDFVQNIDSKTGYSGYRVVEALTNSEWSAYHRITKDHFQSLGLSYDSDLHTPINPHHRYLVLRQATSIIAAAHLHFDNQTALLKSLAFDQNINKQEASSNFLNIIQLWVHHQNLHFMDPNQMQ